MCRQSATRAVASRNSWVKVQASRDAEEVERGAVGSEGYRSPCIGDGTPVPAEEVHGN